MEVILPLCTSHAPNLNWLLAHTMWVDPLCYLIIGCIKHYVTTYSINQLVQAVTKLKISCDNFSQSSEWCFSTGTYSYMWHGIGPFYFADPVTNLFVIDLSFSLCFRSQYPTQMIPILLDHTLSYPFPHTITPSQPTPLSFTTLTQAIEYLSRTHRDILKHAIVNAFSDVFNRGKDKTTAASFNTIRMLLLVATHCQPMTQFVAMDCLEFGKSWISFPLISLIYYDSLEICIFVYKMHNTFGGQVNVWYSTV